MSADNWKQAVIGPCITVVFLAGGGWVTLEAVAQSSDELTERIEVVEDKVGQQQVIQVKVEQVEQRLQRLETAIDKMIEIQQVQMQNQAAICASTGATCR